MLGCPQEMESLTHDTGWLVTKTDADQSAIESANTVFTISNGYMALKGNLLENRQGAYPTTLIAGVFDQADMMAFIRPTKHERRYLDPEYFDGAAPSPSVANLPDPLFVRVFLDGKELSFSRGAITGFRQVLNLREGIYRYEYDHQAPDGKVTRTRMERFCDMRNVHRAVMRYSLTPLNYSGRITIRSGIDGSVRSNLKGDRQFAVVHADGWGDSGCGMQVRTIARGIEVSVAVGNLLSAAAAQVADTAVEDEAVYNVFDVYAQQGQEIVLEKHIALASSEDARHGAECDPVEEVQRSMEVGFVRACEEQRAFWRETWDRMDVEIGGDSLAQLYLRFCLFHVMSAAPRHTDKLSVPCKLLTGEHYQGTTFYDTDLYIEPGYLFTFPEIARTCLNYRYLGLKPARKIAASLGYKGAKFAWQSGPYGDEALGKWWRFTHTNIHINGDVAYSLMQYWYATRDTRFLIDRGIDILVEAARFYVSRATYDGPQDQYDFEQVAGPDEGHCESKNNFYTNLLAKKTLVWASETLDLIQRDWPGDYQQVVKRLGIDADEPQTWRTVADRLAFYYDPETKVYEQCEGFYQLAPIPADLVEGRRDWFLTVFPYQALNQPDVVMGIVLLRDEFPDEVKRANWEFYKDKSMNFSSMSFVINAMMAKEVGDLDFAYRQFLISAGEDLDEDLTGRRDTAEGIHGTACGGAWMAAVLGFGGVLLTERGLSVSPRLPSHWQWLKFKLVLRGEVLSFAIDQSRVRISVGSEKGLDLGATIAGHPARLQSGKEYQFAVG